MKANPQHLFFLDVLFKYHFTIIAYKYLPPS